MDRTPRLLRPSRVRAGDRDGTVVSDIRVGQIWKEVDPRMERFVRVVRVTPGGDAMIRRVIYALNQWTVPARSPERWVDPHRFNGKRGGYALHQDAQP